MPPTSRIDLPPLVTEAIAVLGSPVRVAVIASLGSQGPATRSELAWRMGVTRTLLQAHVQMLEDRGIVHTMPPRSEPGRLQRRYYLDVSRVEQLRDALASAITPSSDQ